MKNFISAKVDDKVWSSLYGFGIITHILDYKKDYPIWVEFAKHNINLTYSINGFSSLLSHQYPNLFWEEQKLDFCNEEPEIDWLKVPIDTPVLVSDFKNDKKIKRFFAFYIPTNKAFVCLANGKNLETATTITYWNHCEIDGEIKEEWLK